RLDRLSIGHQRRDLLLLIQPFISKRKAAGRSLPEVNRWIEQPIGPCARLQQGSKTRKWSESLVRLLQSFRDPPHLISCSLQKNPALAVGIEHQLRRIALRNLALRNIIAS